MKKKKLIFASILLLIIAIPLVITFGNFDGLSFLKTTKLLGDASRSDSGYTYKQIGIESSVIYGSTLPDFKVSSTSRTHRTTYVSYIGRDGETHYGYPIFFHEAQKDGRYYFGYCLHMGYRAWAKTEDGDTPTLTAYIYDGKDFDEGFIENTAGVDLNSNQIKMLEALLSVAHQYSSDHTRSISDMSDDEATEAFVTQLLIWEIVEGGRTYWGGAHPDYAADDSGFVRVATHYSDIYNRLMAEASNAQASMFGETHTDGGSYELVWNNNTKKYQRQIDVGDYKCSKASGANIDVSQNGNTITVTATTQVKNAGIECSKVIGSGSNKWIYYKFDNVSNQWQDIVNGTAGKTLTKSYRVSSTGSNVKVIKQDASGKTLDNVKFKLTQGNTVINLDGNGSAKTLNVGGRYTLTEIETSTPHGYKTMNEAQITFDFASQAVSSSSNKVTASFDTNSNTYILTVKNDVVDFRIRKTAEDEKVAVKGARFEVFNGGGFNTPVKFDKSGCTYTYNKDKGAYTYLQDNACSDYSLLLLAKGTYKVVETDVPSPYKLASDIKDRTHYLYVDDNYKVYDCRGDSSCKSPQPTNQNIFPVKNYTTKVNVKKTGAGGKALAGVKFVLLDQSKNTYINSTTTNGVYNYSGTTAEVSNATVYVTNGKGIITVNNLDPGTYFFKEIETVDPYVLPEGDDAYTKVVIVMTKDGPKVNNKLNNPSIDISNATKEFNFYKVDENGNYLSGGKYKVQKYNEDKGKYEDIKLSSVENDGTYQEEADVFKEDEKEGKVQFTLAHGIATFIEMAPSSTYRVVEIEAPKGYQITDVENSAVIKIDKNGYAKGSASIINQSKHIEGSSAQAELIIEIQTGQTVIRYGLIITGTLIIIASLMGALIFISKKRK